MTWIDGPCAILATVVAPVEPAADDDPTTFSPARTLGVGTVGATSAPDRDAARQAR